MIDIAIAVVEHQGQFLIGQRPAGVALGGLWEFPGGKVEPSESPANAAVRECLEEAGVLVQAGDEYPRREHDYTHAAVHLHFFRCRLLSVEQHPKWPFRWVPRAELALYEFPAGNAELLALIAAEG